MEQNAIDTHEKYLLELLRGVLRAEKAPEIPQSSIQGIFAAAKRHSLSGMALYALENAGIELQGEVAQVWQQERDKALVKDITQSAELERIEQAFEAAGIRILPLKGSVIKALYPQSDMRTMSDIDALIDLENAERAREIMEELGYSCECFNHHVHDIYYMPPVMNVEIHRELFGDEGKEFAEIFADPWSMSTHEGAVYSLAPDEFFAYILAHALKHIEEGGTGIRTVMDVWVCMNAELGIDAEKALALLASSGREDEARTLIELSKVWFGESAHSQSTMELERYILNSGTYGTVANCAEHKIRKAGKVRYFWGLVFPSLQKMRQRYPVLKKAPWLLPVFWVVRIVTKPFTNRSQNMIKFKALMRKSDD